MKSKTDPKATPWAPADNEHEDGPLATLPSTDAGEHTALDSDVLGPDGTPVVRYGSAEEKARFDKKYKVRVTDVMRGADATGNASVTLNGYKYVFPLGETVEMYGFQIMTLRGCTHPSPRTVEVDGQLKKAGTYERSRFRVEVENDI